jgi:hypothetical protein
MSARYTYLSARSFAALRLRVEHCQCASKGQYLYLCTSKTSKLSLSARSFAALRLGVASSSICTFVLVAQVK